ncbi:MAG: putative 5' nucleotidase family protein [Streblomastix strix]|uniref:Putative 5' nucleotidase family protein n=1 Tax=Streblomastix strix TaxID=222440 RepID=A0A5J4XB19_9EUKA|nr:MAG: putative 5' nucleotidase family protein [Streblomastix strix]
MKTSTILFALFLLRFVSGKLNITLLHTTDVHGWIYGHDHQNYDADFGDVYNFIRHGTGLSDATPTQGEFIFDIAKKIPYDGLCIGNHELGSATCVDLIADNFAPYWQGKFISGNVKHTDATKKLTDDYFNISLPNEQGRIVVLGFLYNLGSAAANVKLTKVADTLALPYITEALNDESTDPTQKIRLVVALCHISTGNAEVEQIRQKVRSLLPKTPLILLTGHSHRFITKKSWDPEDKYSYAMESSYYMNKVGRISVIVEDDQNTDPIFSNAFLDGSKSALYKAAGFTTAGKKGDITWATEIGTEITTAIQDKYSELQLSQELGTAPKQFYRSPSPEQVTNCHSLHNFLVDRMMPYDGPYSQYTTTESETAQKGSNRKSKNDSNAESDIITVAVLGSSTLRYDIYKRKAILNDIYANDPFDDPLQVNEIIDGIDMQKVVGQNVAFNAQHYPEEKDDDDDDDDDGDTDTETQPTDTDPETGEKDADDGDDTDSRYSFSVGVGAILVSVMVSVAFSLIST